MNQKEEKIKKQKKIKVELKTLENNLDIKQKKKLSTAQKNKLLLNELTKKKNKVEKENIEESFEDNVRTRNSTDNNGNIIYRYRKKINKNVKVSWRENPIELQIIETDF